MQDFVFFWSGPFSQWYPSHFQMNGVRFNTAEQAMMYAKAMLFRDKKTAAKILEARKPREQKALGREVKNFDSKTWDGRKLYEVVKVNHAKFHQNPDLRAELFKTGTAQIVEASPNDAIWGIGLDEQAARNTPIADWPGNNLLGIALTKVRAELKNEFPDEFARFQNLAD
jgi:hypothetical protein